MNSELRSARGAGVALLAALILALAVVVVLGNIFYRHQIDVAQSSAILHGDQALLMAISAESWARQRLSGKPEMDDTAVDHLGEVWAQALPILPMEGGVIRGCIQDLQARLNLNNFVLYTNELLNRELSVENKQKMGTARLWHNLLVLFEMPVSDARSAALVDWLDSDSELINLWGAEQADYDGQRIPRVVANTLITDVGELAAVKGYLTKEVLALMPLITALPLKSRSSNGTAININTASTPLLYAIGGSFGLEFADIVLGARSGRRYFTTVADLHDELESQLPLSRKEIEIRWPEGFLDVRSDFFLLHVDVSLGGTNLQVKSIIDRQKDPANPTVMAREVTVVPKFAIPPQRHRNFAIEEDYADLHEISNDTETYRIQTACETIGV